MAAKPIPAEVRREVLAMIARFNREGLADRGCSYVPRFSEQYLYLDRSEYGSVGPVCRLEYTGDMQDWQFAMYQYCSGQYGTGSSFPGSQFLDGSVCGALKAATQGYD